MLIRVADEFGFKIATLQHVLEGYKVANEIAAHGAGASTFADWWGYKIEAFDAIPYNAALMTRKGVVVSINSDSAEHARRLNIEAAKSMQVGRADRGRGARARHDQPGEAAPHRQSRRLDRSRQGRRRRDLEPSSAQLLRDRRSRVHRRPEVLRPAGRSEAADRARDGEGDADQRRKRRAAESDDDRARRRAPAAANRRRGATVPRTTGDLRQRRRVAAPAGPRSQRASTTKLATRGVLAITNAKIVPGREAAIERGTIVIRDGIIESVGANVSVPSGAQVIDAAGARSIPASSTLGRRSA